MDQLSINQLKLPATIGVHAWEQAVQRHLILDIVLFIDVKKVAESDDLQTTYDYQHIAESLATLLEQQKFLLVETAAECIAEHLFTHFAIREVILSVTKPRPVTQMESVTIKIHRKQ